MIDGLTPYPAYKDSGVPWIGRVPEHWTLRTVRQVGAVQGGKQLAPKAPGELRPYLRVANVLDGRIDTRDVRTMPFTDEEFSRFRLLPDDLLLNEGQSLDLVGRTARYRGAPHAYAIQNALVRVRAFREHHPAYLEHLFRHCQASGIFAMISMQTTSIAHLGVGRLASLRVWLSA